MENSNETNVTERKPKQRGERHIDPKLIQTVGESRKARKMTQTQLSKKSGISQADISKIERGLYNPTLALLTRLADALDMELQVKFVEKDPADPESFDYFYNQN